MKVRTLGYLRVSTDRQAEQGLGLEVQRAAIEDWSRSQRRRLVGITSDEGISGAAELVDRAGLASALGRLANGEAEELVVYRIDRLARDLILQEWLRSEVVRMGCELRSVSPTEDQYLREDPDDPTGQLVRRILGAVAEYERAMIRLRMRAGLERKRAGGGYVGGRPPYGWAAHRGALVPVEDEQHVLDRARRLRSRGASWRDVVAELEAAGARTRKGTPWSPTGISRAVETANTRRILPRAKNARKAARAKEVAPSRR